MVRGTFSPARAWRPAVVARLARSLGPAENAPRMLAIRPALPADAHECVRLRGMTRENAVSPERLASIGITAHSWARDIESGKLPGWVCTNQDEMVGYCFGDNTTGEVIVLALLPAHEGQGLGRRLLAMVTEHLRSLGHSTLFLGCATDTKVRSHGFYRHLGWQSTGHIDRYGDEVLELQAS